MDALFFALLVVVSCLIGWAIRLLAADHPILGNVWRFRPLGWPSGVQEDDDLHWRWRAPAPSGPPLEHVRPRITLGGRIGAKRGGGR